MICEVNTAFGMQFTLPVVTLAQGVGMVDIYVVGLAIGIYGIEDRKLSEKRSSMTFRR